LDRTASGLRRFSRKGETSMSTPGSPLFKARTAGLCWLLSLTIWLLVKGVSVQRWNEQASASREW
jgi:hypothetical protein